MTHLLLLPTNTAAPASAAEGKAGSNLAAATSTDGEVQPGADAGDTAEAFSNLLAGKTDQQPIADLSSPLTNIEPTPAANSLPLLLTTDPESIVLEEVDVAVQTLLQTEAPKLLEDVPAITLTGELPADSVAEGNVQPIVATPDSIVELPSDRPIVVQEDGFTKAVEPVNADQPAPIPVEFSEIDAELPEALLIPEVFAGPTVETDQLSVAQPIVPVGPELPAVAEVTPIDPELPISDEIIPIATPEAPTLTVDDIQIIEDQVQSDQTDAIAAPLLVEGETIAPPTKPVEATPGRHSGQPATPNPANPLDANASQEPEQAQPLPAANQPAPDRQASDDRRLNQNTQTNQTIADAAKSLTQGDGKTGQQGDDRSGQQSQTPTNLIDLGADTSSRNTERTGRPSFANALLNAGHSAHLESEFDELPARLRIAAANGIERLTVSLRPAALGAMEVHFDTAEDGALRANFVVQRPETLDLLQRDSRALERALGDAGLNVDKDSLNFSLSDQGGQQSQFGQDDELADNFGGQSNDLGAGESTDTEILTDIPLDTAAMIEAGRIDVRI